MNGRAFGRVRRTALKWILALSTVGFAVRSSASPGLREAEHAIDEIELPRAEDLLRGQSGEEASYLRALLSVYRADCDGAQAILSSPTFREDEQAAGLYDLAKRCAAATAGSVVVEDEKHGVWLRLQDDKDRVLVPLIAASAARARDSIEKDLGVDLPRPLRIDLVRDLFSLAALTGLPLSAAETTGTVAVARWGRVTMVSPRAMQLGFPWQDTLAHEITHLILARGSRDRAPLWLQEGIAKREETRWRDPRPFDASPDPNRVAFDALQSGRSVGIDQLGQSIAMLPTPEAASIAFAEVSSFMEYWIEENGPAALTLLLEDMKVAEDADAAIRSVSGYGLTEWKLRWQEHVRDKFGTAAPPDQGLDQLLGPVSARELSRWLRLSELLVNAQQFRPAAELLEPRVAEAPRSAPLRWSAARAAWLAGKPAAQEALGTLRDVDAVHGAWLAVRGQWMKNPPVEGDDAASDSLLSAEAPRRTPEELFEHAVAVDPLSVDVACEGVPRYVPPPRETPPLPQDAARRALCEHARTLPERGTE